MRFKSIEPGIEEFEGKNDPLNGIENYYNSLSESDKKLMIDILEGNTNRMVDPGKYKEFVKSVAEIKKFFKEKSARSKIDIDLKDGSIEIVFDRLEFDSLEHIKDAMSKAKCMQMYSRRDGRILVIIEYDVIVRLK